MMTFDQFLEKKSADDVNWPQDCDMKTLGRKATTDMCYVEPGGNHDKVRDRLSSQVVTSIPRHRALNPYTCKSVVRDIKVKCYR